MQKFLDEREEQGDPNEPLEGANARRGGTRGAAIRTSASKRSLPSEEETARKKPRKDPNPGRKSPGKSGGAPPPTPEVPAGKGKSGGKGGPAKGALKQLTPASTPPPPKPKSTPSASTGKGLGVG